MKLIFGIATPTKRRNYAHAYGGRTTRKFFQESSDGVKLNSVVGKATNQTGSDLLTNLLTSIHNIEAEIENLTKSESAGERIENIDVVKFIREYSQKVASKYSRKFSVEISETLSDSKGIRLSPKAFIELLDNVVSNAVRHGFTGDRDDYVLHFFISSTSTGRCRIDIANNGNPISERGRKEFFVRGSFAGETGHTGIGGARIFEICEDANGVALEPYSTEKYSVVVSVEFPIVSL